MRVAAFAALLVVVSLPFRAGGEERPWSIRTRAVMSGSSDHSEPDGYTEKSGMLDSTDLSPWVGPAIALGADFDVSSALFLNLDVLGARF